MSKDDVAVDLDVASLGRYAKREFLPEDAKLIETDEVVAFYQKLADLEINDTPSLEKFLQCRSELDAAIQQVSAALYVRMTCQTDDTERAAAYTKFVSEVVPAVKPFADMLDRKYLAAKDQYGSGKKLYEVYDREIQSHIDLFRQENVDLQTQDDLLSQEYQTVCGKMSVTLDGQEYTMPQITKFQQETDRGLREKAWRAATERRLEDVDTLNEVFAKMLSVRKKLAVNTGMETFREYQFEQYHRFDYTPDDCKAFHKAVEDVVVPAIGEIHERRRSDMGLDNLRPWDMAVDPLGREPLKPFEKVGDLIRKTGDIFTQIAPELGDQFRSMDELGLLDLASRKGKAPGGYQTSLTEARKPFIFVNAVGINYDMVVLLHEGGHAFHSFACADQSLFPYRHAPMEFCEVASMSMELLALPYLSAFYNEEDARRARISQLKRSISLLPSVALIDKFQHWIYENPDSDVKGFAEKFREFHNTFAGSFINYNGLEKQQGYDWHRILHIFQVPFYYIEYGIAQLGALQMWLQAKEDMPGAIANYRKALALGGSRPLPELFEAAGIRFDFSAETIEPLVKAVVDELKSLER